MTEGNPFEAPVTRPAARRPRPGCRRLVLFSARHMVLVGVLPPLVAAVMSVVASFWLVWAVGVLVMLPIAAIQLWAIFLAPISDARPAVLASGLVMNRSTFVWVNRASALERVLGATGVVLAVLAFSVVSRIMVVFAPFVILLAVWVALSAWQSERMARAMVATLGEDNEESLRLLGPILRWPRLNWLAVGPARITAGHALSRLGRAEEAIDAYGRVRGATARQAELYAAQLRVGRGDTEAGHAALTGRKPRNLGEQLAYEFVHCLLALEEHRPDDVIERTRGWKYLQQNLGPHLAQMLGLLEAAAWAQKGDPDRARRVIAALDATVPAYMAALYPTLFALLDGLDQI